MSRFDNAYLYSGAATVSAVAIAHALPLTTLLIPGIAMFGFTPFVNTAMEAWRRERRIVDEASYVTCLAGALFAQAFVAVGSLLFLVWLQQVLHVATKDRSQRDVRELFGKHVSRAFLLVDGLEVGVPIDRLEAGNVIAVHAGETVPVDGIIVAGGGRADQRMLTGEDRLVELAVGDRAYAATILLGGLVHISVEQAGRDTTAGRMIQHLNRTSEYRLSTEIQAKRMADAIAPYYVAAGLAVIPLLGLSRAVSVLITAPGPWYLMTALPLGMLRTLSVTARRGIAILDGRTLEMLPQVDTVIFDKTGTLTESVPLLHSIWTEEQTDEATVLRLAAAAEHRQSHPLAHAIREAASRFGVAPSTPDDVDYVVSNGVRAKVKGHLVHVGSARYLASQDVKLAPAAQRFADECSASGYSLVHVASNGRQVGALSFRTRIRAEAAEVVRDLCARGLQVRILSGDGGEQTRAVAKEIGVDAFDGELLPDGKAAVVRRLREEGRFVCFVGDGINDVLAMREAQVSVAVADASTIATAVAGVIIYDRDLRSVSELIEIGAMFQHRTRQSLIVSSIPTAAGVAAVALGSAGMMTAVASYGAATLLACGLFLRPWPTGEKRRRIADARASIKRSASNALSVLKTSRFGAIA
jgi:Cu2+-exporting ATPase